MVVRVAIKPVLLEWAIKRSGRSMSEIEHKFPKVQQWLAESYQPSLKQLKDFAAFTYTPFGYFFLQAPPKEMLPIPLYRTLDSQQEPNEASVNLMDTIQTMQSRQSWLRDYLIERGADPLSFVQSANIHDNVAEVARHIRKTLKLTTDWAAKHTTWTDALNFLRETIEDIGILVVVNGIVGNNTHRKLDPQEFRGFVLVDEYSPLLFINGADGKAAQMFTLAHELAHVFFGYSAAFDLRGSLPSADLIEVKCDQVAAEFLVPAYEFKVAWDQAEKTHSIFQHMARKFKVSEIVIARRSLDLAFIDKPAFFSFYERYQAEERKTKAAQSGGGNFFANQKFRIGKRFAESVILATKEGSLLYSEAYQLTGLRGKTFDEFANSIGYEV